MSAYRIAVQTRGMERDYQWAGNSRNAEAEAAMLGAILHNQKPGVMVYKYANDDFGILLANVIRPSVTDHMGTRIRIQVYIGGLSEVGARALVITALEKWQEIECLHETVFVAENEREWNANFPVIEERAGAMLARCPLEPDDSSFPTRQSGRYEDSEFLYKDLRSYRFSDRPGYKLYWGGIPSKEGDALRHTVDRFYCTNAKPGRLPDPPQISPLKTESKAMEEEPKTTISENDQKRNQESGDRQQPGTREQFSNWDRAKADSNTKHEEIMDFLRDLRHRIEQVEKNQQELKTLLLKLQDDNDRSNQS